MSIKISFWHLPICYKKNISKSHPYVWIFLLFTSTTSKPFYFDSKHELPTRTVIHRQRIKTTYKLFELQLFFIKWKKKFKVDASSYFEWDRWSHISRIPVLKVNSSVDGNDRTRIDVSLFLIRFWYNSSRVVMVLSHRERKTKKLNCYSLSHLASRIHSTVYPRRSNRSTTAAQRQYDFRLADGLIVVALFAVRRTILTCFFLSVFILIYVDF